ncbi:hypothetical protein HGRIS_013890 [Hohenbuehelia grisea]|uniref:Flavin reductase like domain-containing protein n=1 Tax=Hohenbuehelia grisea TaxID=104357 RepID=A0ABR3IX55_9AGAR
MSEWWRDVRRARSASTRTRSVCHESTPLYPNHIISLNAQHYMADLPPFTPSTFKQTEAPVPDWQSGQSVTESAEGREWIAGEEQGWKVIDTAAENPMNLYKLMISGIVPRPIAFVSSVSADGVENLAPFSWFNMVTHNPPVISVSVSAASGRPGDLKDTASNIKATKEFTVNVISEPWVQNANFCSMDMPPEVSEWPSSGLTKADSVIVRAPRVKESAFSMECELLQPVEVVNPQTGKPTTTLILGLVKYIHVRNDMLNERGNVDPAKFKPVSRMGDITYATLGDGFRLPRPLWKDEEENVMKAVAERPEGSNL